MGNCVSERHVFTDDLYIWSVLFHVASISFDYFDFATQASWYNSKANKLKVGNVYDGNLYDSGVIPSQFIWFHVMTGHCASEPPHQYPSLYEELSREQQYHQLIKKTQGACLRLRTQDGGILIRTQRSNEEHKLNKIHKTLMCLCVAHVEPAWAWLVRPWSTAAGWAGKPCVTTLKSSGGATSIGWTDSLEDVTHFHTLVSLQ